jgi:integral membrane protein
VNPNPYPLLRAVALAEGVSFLLLLGIAMPLKYLAKLPVAVLIAGSLHGALFLLFVACWQRARTRADWPTPRAVRVFVAALLPFGPFVVDRGMKRWEQEFLARQR